jgi:drug/metabolite transporter (DMT)-like permease
MKKTSVKFHAAWGRSTHTTRGIVWMVWSCVLTSFMVVILRLMSELDIPFTQAVFFRNAAALVFFLPWAIRQGSKVLKTSRLQLYSARATVGLVAMYIWFYSLTVLSLPTATALSFTAPLMNALLAVILLKEHFGIHRITALIIGFLGALVILRPGSEAFDANGLFVIFSATLWAWSAVIIKNLSKTESPNAIAFYMVLLMTPMSLPLALMDWTWPTMQGWILIAALGITSNMFQVALSKAIAITEFAVILPFDYTRLLFTSIMAYLIFGEVLDFWTFIGSLIIMASAVYTAYREHAHARKATSHPNASSDKAAQ